MIIIADLASPYQSGARLAMMETLLLHGNQPTANVKPNWSLWRRVLLLKSGDPGLGRKAGIVPNSQEPKTQKAHWQFRHPHTHMTTHGRMSE
jgi:hypothetical protein